MESVTTPIVENTNEEPKQTEVTPVELEQAAVEPEVVADAEPAEVAEADAPAETTEAEPEVNHVELLRPMLDCIAEGKPLDGELVQKLADDLGTQPEIIELLGLGFQAKQQERIGTIYEAAGSPESYKEMTEWATQGLPREEAEAFNKVLGTGTIDELKTAVSGLKQKFTEVNGSPKVEAKAVISNKPVANASKPASNGNAGVKPFASFSELQEAQRDPRYRKDPAYTNEVYQRAHLMG